MKSTLTFDQLKKLVTESRMVEEDDIKRALLNDSEISKEILATACLNYMDIDKVWEMAENEFGYEKSDLPDAGGPAERYEIYVSRLGDSYWHDFNKLYRARNSNNKFTDIDGPIPKSIWYVNVALNDEDWYEGLFTSEDAARTAVNDIDESELADEEEIGRDPVLIRKLPRVATSGDLNRAIVEVL